MAFTESGRGAGESERGTINRKSSRIDKCNRKTKALRRGIKRERERECKAQRRRSGN